MKCFDNRIPYLNFFFSPHVTRLDFQHIPVQKLNSPKFQTPPPGNVLRDARRKYDALLTSSLLTFT